MVAKIAMPPTSEIVPSSPGTILVLVSTIFGSIYVEAPVGALETATVICGLYRSQGLQKILAPVQRKARGGQLRQFAKQYGFRPREVEARESLHPLLEFRRHFLAQRRVPVQRHKGEAHGCPARDHRAR